MNQTSTLSLTIIIPTLNEAGEIQHTLKPLQRWRHRGVEIIIVDGGSVDQTLQLARPMADTLMTSKPGRAQQMNRAAQRAQSDYLLFLHADTQLPDAAFERLGKAFRQEVAWGHFDVQLPGHQTLLRVVETMMNLRSRITGIATGDQAIFVNRALFEATGGFPEIALMEDIALSSHLKRHARAHCLETKVITSSRRWEQNGPLRTIALMWLLRLRFFFGANPEKLAKLYR